VTRRISYHFKNTLADQAFAKLFLEIQRQKADDTATRPTSGMVNLEKAATLPSNSTLEDGYGLDTGTTPIQNH
jgi:hypothetical protein